MIREQQERQAKCIFGNESSALMIAQSLGTAQIDVAILLGNVGNDNLPHELQAEFRFMIRSGLSHSNPGRQLLLDCFCCL